MSNKRVLNPKNGTYTFGFIPALTLVSQNKGIIQTQYAPIHLTEGKHFSANTGWGVTHIWAEHSQDVINAGYTSISGVPDFVESILNKPANIYFEDRSIKRTRVNCVRIVTGTVVLEYVRLIVDKIETPYWRVVTAYSNTRTNGVLVGNI